MTAENVMFFLAQGWHCFLWQAGQGLQTQCMMWFWHTGAVSHVQPGPSFSGTHTGFSHISTNAQLSRCTH